MTDDELNWALSYRNESLGNDDGHMRDDPARCLLGAGAAALISVALGALILGLLVLLSGCTPGRAYVEADRATYEAVAPRHARYVEADLSLDDERRARRLRTLESWRARLEEAEK